MIVGSGPNGLSAAITLAKAGYRVKVIEGKETIGGGCRSKELTLPGFIHDVCAAIHPLGISSPFFRDLPLADYGLQWIHPTLPLAHPLDDGTAVLVHRSIDETSETLGRDAETYRKIMKPLAENYREIIQDYLGPLQFPRYPLRFAGFGLMALPPASLLAKSIFRGPRARAVFCGMAAHSIMPLSWPGTSAFGWMLGMLTHAVGWPMAMGGSQAIVNAMAKYLHDLGGVIETGRFVTTAEEVLSEGQFALFDTTPRQLLKIAGDHFTPTYQLQLASFRYGPGVFKLDLALDGPIPWKAEECCLAGTVHVGGTMEEIIESERLVGQGKHPQRPFVLVAQTSQFDPTRAPQGKHAIWSYCHVPNGSTVDMSEQIEAQIERFAPGFRQRIIARHKTNAVEMQAYNPNYIGGDINAGMQDLTQLFTRPAVRIDPYATTSKRIYICSSSTPPGGGVHGMCGYYAAQSALRNRLD